MPSVRGIKGLRCVSWREIRPLSGVLPGGRYSVRGTLGVKVCVLGGDMPSIQGTLGVKVIVLGGDTLRPGYSRG